MNNKFFEVRYNPLTCASVFEVSVWDTFKEAREFAIGRYSKPGLKVAIVEVELDFQNNASTRKCITITNFKVSKKGYFKKTIT